MYNLTEAHKNLARWIVNNIRAGSLKEEFAILWMNHDVQLTNYTPNSQFPDPDITKSAIDILAENKLLHYRVNYRTSKSGRSSESSRVCSVLAELYKAVDSDFNAPNISFVQYLTPLADITHLDDALKQRCLPILATGSADPMLWDAVVRTAGVILEERLRDVGGIADPNRTGADLVNLLFGNTGILRPKFAVASECQGYRDLYAGLVGAIRNPSAHPLIDPTPEEGGATILFINLLLKKLEALR